MTATSIRELRDSTGLTQKAFAKLYHIPLSTLRKWEQGSASPPDYVIELIAKSLPVTNNNLKQIGSGKNAYYFDAVGNTLFDKFGNKIPVNTDLTKVNPHNLSIYIRDLFNSYYEAIARFERDCRYDEEENILWSTEDS